MSYAGKTTTNNLAEYMGLLVGLIACAKNRWTPLNVVGDSAMIITQQLRRSPPMAAHLKATEHNKTADALASSAMDLRISAQIDLGEDRGHAVGDLNKACSQ
ncbi:hypothetical protein PHMEG_0008488 [Phytophthora megakarya]|uniref:RNase H type-1 domain-containing protein n=1 Tax=Phytophthora megakarya TaxID=4795 RepID=A0A225WJY4_9STRA|nr:hypothetical protein PHMEG_0008488 [Phytophthora megakarya]